MGLQQNIRIIIMMVRPNIHRTLHLEFARHTRHRAHLRPRHFCPLRRLFRMQRVTFIKVLPHHTRARTHQSYHFHFTHQLRRLFGFRRPLNFRPNFMTQTLQTMFTVFQADSNLGQRRHTSLRLAEVRVLTVRLLHFGRRVRRQFFGWFYSLQRYPT